MRFSVLLRALCVAAMVACTVAVLVARTFPRAATFRLRCESDRTTVNGLFFAPSDSSLRVLDTATGGLSLLPMPQGGSLTWASFSDWVSDSGEREVVGQWAEYQGEGERRVMTAVGLARFSFPSGRLLGRISECQLPICAPCWYPGESPRVLFADSDGQLHQCAFAGAGASAARAEVQLVSWTGPPAPLREPRVTHVVWPKTLNGRLIASVDSLATPRRRGPCRLWWLRLSPDGMSVADAGPLTPDDVQDGISMEYCVPSVVALPGGGHLVAYQRRSRAAAGELFVAPLTADPQTGEPTIDAAAARKLAGDVMGAPPSFSPDGAWVYAVQRRAVDRAVLRRFAVHDAGR